MFHHRAAQLIVTGSCGFAAWACASSQNEAVFGGEGADVQAKQTPLDPAAPEEDTGPCGKPAPASSTKLIDDFEDADNQIFKTFQREGWWYVAVDETPGTVFPNVGEFKASALPEGEATVENRFALHGKAEGFRDWGVVWGSTLRYVNSGIKCPFNGSQFIGLTFRAKGNGTIHFKIGTPSTVPGEFEGKCKQKCWDMHGKKIPLTPEWQPYVVRFDLLQQGGWGTEAQFDPQRMMGLSFAVDGKDLPIEFWLDDIHFLAAGDPIPQQLNPPAAPVTAPEAGATPEPSTAPERAEGGAPPTSSVVRQ